MDLRVLKIRTTILLVFSLVLGFSSYSWGEVASNVQVRFANPQFDKQTQTYSLDVEMRSNSEGDQLFGMNVRFFYDASMMEFTSIGDFAEGYRVLGAAPKAHKGNSLSGSQLFRLYESVAYINTAIQLMEEDTPAKMSVNKWTYYFKVYFKVAELELENKKFAPSVIWDVRSTHKGGGYFKGSDGALVTLIEKDPTTRQTSSPANLEGLPFNWVQTNSWEAPYGYPLAQTVLPLKNGFDSSPRVSVPLDGDGYLLMQNQPNPFVNETKIDFYLPDAESVRFNIFDLNGKLVRTQEGDYSAGYNSITINRSDLNSSASVFLYRFETTNYSSPVKKMILVDKP